MEKRARARAADEPLATTIVQHRKSREREFTLKEDVAGSGSRKSRASREPRLEALGETGFSAPAAEPCANRTAGTRDARFPEDFVAGPTTLATYVAALAGSA